MSATILQVYQTEVDWLALIALTSGERVTMAFNHQPTESEIAARVAAIEAPVENEYEIAARVAAIEAPVENEYEIECEDGTVV